VQCKHFKLLIDMKNKIAFLISLGLMFLFVHDSKAQKIETGFCYRLTTEWQGTAKSLEVVNDDKKQNVQLGGTESGSWQEWVFTPSGDEGAYRITSAWADAKGKSLEVVNDDKKENVQLGGTESGSWQEWKLTPLGNGYYRITSAWADTNGKSVDILNDGQNNNKLTLAKTGNYTGQHWKLTKVRPVD
jgi:hypothetical protein